MKIKALKAAFPYTVPVLFGYLVLGIAFGALLVATGYPFWLAPIMSITIYAGSMQFVAITLLATGAGPLACLAMTLLVNARHLFYGLSLIDRFKSLGKKKAYIIFALTDETYSVLCSKNPPKDVDVTWFYFFVSILNHLYWIIGSTLGAVAGSLIPFNTKGIDFAMTALFIVILVEQWESNKNHLPALLGIGITVVCRIIFGTKYFLVFALLGILFSLIIGKNKINDLDQRLNKVENLDAPPEETVKEDE